ncbi:hypothetical protein MT49_0614 [Mycobacterium tuberculosis 49-02]|uniref:Uncharacterized protein n=1 Tax=Mycobacterium tuberculosis (strain CDC 1551 / Oshkosh) TaxID=83331 RepID=Q8VKI6_MYCTO|nr:hypothetical protein MT0603 [Mycobacterium tuberculosis CDC1551]CDM08780.1 hypothetical protein MT49_0614 [Mycobacterium tuberculosis 49-02]
MGPKVLKTAPKGHIAGDKPCLPGGEVPVGGGHQV